MSKDDYPYPEDEFDTLGANRVPQGVHREPTPRWRQWLPYVLVLVLVPLLTFGAVKFFAGDDAETAPSASPTEDSDNTDGDVDEEPEAEPDEDEATDDEPSDTDESEESDDDTSSEEPDADLDQSVSVLVLNGAGVQGLAGQVTDLLNGQGWTQTEADNYSAEQPTGTTLYYTSAEFEAEAQAVAEALGVTNTVESASAASNGIVIVVRSDFSLPT